MQGQLLLLPGRLLDNCLKRGLLDVLRLHVWLGELRLCPVHSQPGASARWAG